ncbi:hypothetical protein [Tautonia sociabilis]|uniref:hypothetical protein n=1 Tax=Tautonia sociabilis TaxID=2080755 RepID=UPI001F2F3300|nr:hypothetical protein [Tautonia sociabilis]
MDLSGAVVAGLVATSIMTVLIYVGPKMGMPRMDMLGMLGTMFTQKRAVAYPLGTVLHFAIGVLFAAAYALLWGRGLGDATWPWGLAFGAAHGVIAIAVLPLMLRMHPRPPGIRMTPLTVAGMMMGHLVFGLAVALVYGALKASG